MRDRNGPFDAHACLVEAGKQILTRVRYEDVAFWLDCSAKTIHRMATCDGDCEAQWTIARLVRLLQFEQEKLGTAMLAAAITSLIDGVPPPRGDSLLIRADLVNELRDDAEVQARIATALTDSQVSRREAAELLDAIKRRRQDEDARLIPDLVQLIGST